MGKGPFEVSEQTGLGPECLQLGKSPGLCALPKVRAGGAARRWLGSCTWHRRRAPGSPGPRCAGTESGSRLPADSSRCSAGRVNSGEERRRGLALQPSAVHLLSCDPCRSPGPHTIPCRPASPHYLGGDQGQRLSRQRALRGGDTREPRDLPRGGARRKH